MPKRLDALLERLVALEADVRYQEYASREEPEFLYISGNIPILVSAPHGAAHTRRGKYKGEDEYTSALARLIGEETGAHCIYARRRSRTDPNVAKDAPYKEMVREICELSDIKFVLDLHGMWPHHESGIELGTRNGKSCPNHMGVILRSLDASDFTVDSKEKISRLRVDVHYSGNGSATREPMIKFVSERLSIPAAQFEINAHNRIVVRRDDSADRDKEFSGNPDAIEKTVQAFINMVIALNGHVVNSL